MKLYAYKNGSKSAKALAEALGIKRLNHEGGKVRDMVINWGSSSIDREVDGEIINHPLAVSRAVNKLVAFTHLNAQGVQIPKYCTTKAIAIDRVRDGKVLVCRTKLTGHSGEGIVIANTIEELVDAPLYTVYVPKLEEFRVHVMHGQAFFIQRKARKLDVPKEEVNWKVRNLKGGFIYANKDIDLDQEAQKLAVDAIIALGLSFGAVDIIQGRDGKYYVLEVNTACGLEGTTLDKYVEQFKRYGI